MAVAVLYTPTTTKLVANTGLSGTPPAVILELDAALSETHALSVKVTEHPVESGAPVTDHAAFQPRSFTLEGIVSNTPIRQDDKRRKTRDGYTISDVDEAQAGQRGRAQAAWNELKRLAMARELVTIITGLESYENMLVTDVSAPRDASTSDALRFSATFRQVSFVSVRRAHPPRASTQRAKPKNNKGSEPAKPAPEPVKKKSLVVSLTEGAGKAWDALTNAGEKPPVGGEFLKDVAARAKEHAG